jgi:hypothetical protein
MSAVIAGMISRAEAQLTVLSPFVLNYFPLFRGCVKIQEIAPTFYVGDPKTPKFPNPGAALAACIRVFFLRIGFIKLCQCCLRKKMNNGIVNKVGHTM